jgi:hypothetical protein
MVFDCSESIPVGKEVESEKVAALSLQEALLESITVSYFELDWCWGNGLK